MLHRAWVQRAIGGILVQYLRFVYLTGRWQVHFDPHALAILERGGNGIGVFWHARIAGIPLLWKRFRRRASRPDMGAWAMVSMHGDGGLIDAVLDPLGVPGVRGSSGKTGHRATRVATAKLEAGDCLAIAIDGPRGPAGRVKKGAIYLAKKQGLPIVPLTYAARPTTTFNSWDRFILPWPFSRGVLMAGPPIWVPTSADPEQARLSVQETLDALNQQAERRLGGADLTVTGDARAT